MATRDEALDGITPKNIEDLERSWKDDNEKNSLHTMAPYSGSFPPELARHFIQEYTAKGDSVLDPFSGGGTTPLEAKLQGREAKASDVFQYAHVLSSAKCDIVERKKFVEYVDSVFEEASNLGGQNVENEDLKVFFSENTLNLLLKLREVQKDRTGRKARLFDALMCGIIHGSSSYHISVPTKEMFPMGTSYVKEYIEKNDLSKPDKNIKSCLLSKYDRVTEDYEPQSKSSADVRSLDATNLDFKQNITDLVLTSPPYLHLISYAYNNWIRIWWLRGDYESERDNIVTTQDLDKFRNFVSDALAEISRVLKDDGKAVIVSGDVKKRKRNKSDVIVQTAKVIAEEAVDLGFSVDELINDAYGSRKKTSFAKFNELRSEVDSKDEIERIDRVVVLSN
jgi:hypothetical protein